ncbi:kinesin-like protein KIN-14P [Heracleum sosnowskyi]|uniref:Kinesin-like protein KIN-14P n=1 Tax=Heracleum sosnowskyi TaxID=360622 RepID=A0AAD8MSU9_9APIA|nr:kinesin-like protein KIN-14P [Heracleum sosnowskyi]
MERQTSMDVFQPSHDKQRTILIEWLNNTVSNVNLPVNASDEDLRAFLADGSVLCQLLNKFKPGSIESSGSGPSSKTGPENVKRFLAAMYEMGLPTFQVRDIEKGSMKFVVDCLLTLRSRLIVNSGGYELSAASLARPPSVTHKGASESNFSHVLWSPVKSGHNFQDVFQIKHGCYADIPPAKIAEMINSNRLDNAPTQSLLSSVNGILDEGVQRKNGEIPHRVACLLRKVVQEIERRISTQAEHLKTQNQLFKVREEKYQSRIRVLEALAAGTGEKTQTLKIITEGRKKAEVQDGPRLINQKDNNNYEIASFKKEDNDNEIVSLKKENNNNHESLSLEKKDNNNHKIVSLEKEDSNNYEIVSLKKELETTKKNYEQLRLQMETTAKESQEIESLKEELKIAKQNYDQLRIQMDTDANGSHDNTSVMQELETTKKNYEQLRLQMETTQGSPEIESLKEELEIAKSNYDQLRLQMEGSPEIESLKKELEIAKTNYDQLRLQMDTDANGSHDINSLKQELETARKDYEQHCLQMETEAKGVQQNLEMKLKEVQRYLTDSKTVIKELESTAESNSQRWNKKDHIYQICAEFQIGVLRELKLSSAAIRQEVTQTQKSYVEDFSRLGTKIKELEKAAQNYDVVLAENRKMHNELQDLKGNIRVYCRIRPFLPGQKAKQTIVDYVGENGELTVVNPSKQGKESRRSFKFNQVYGSKATQVDVYSEIRPLIQSVLDGYNVCIFAYGQTGSGKTYTMSGPDGASEEEWGVNYRAMNDLFNISQRRGSTGAYEIAVQMVEIYNEQVRDLLSTGSQKKLGISSNSQGSGLAVPDASMHPVQSSSDVMDFMEIGLKNRAKSSTAMNERSSRSHSVLTVHARWTDSKTGSLLRALGDVIFALAQKSSHVPYRNSKLTQVLQSSLGGQAKTIMFVQLNPEAISFTESLSTLKFAERVSGVELGAARSSKEGKDVKELMEQVASMKDTIGKKDVEIERLQLLKNGEKRVVATR